MDELKEFEEMIREEPDRADETKIVIETPAEETTVPPMSEEAPPAAVTMSVGQFGATVAGIYCTVSDFVYKRVKKTDTAPAWSDTDRESLTGALVPVLEQYNIVVSPLTNLIVTIAVIEAMRYSNKKGESDDK